MDDLRKYIREIPDFPQSGINFKDITPLVQNPEAFKNAIDIILDYFKDREIDTVAAVESRGFIFASPMAYIKNWRMVLLRKRGKLPAQTVCSSYELEYGYASIEIHQDAIFPHNKVLIVDDLLATGGTAKAAGELVEKLGGRIAGYAFLVELDFLKGRLKIEKHDVFSIIHFAS